MAHTHSAEGKSFALGRGDQGGPSRSLKGGGSLGSSPLALQPSRLEGGVGEGEVRVR